MSRTLIVPLALALVLAACTDRGGEAAPDPGNAVAPDEKPVSIIRDDVREESGAGAMEEEGPIRAVIGFPDGGSDLDAAAVQALGNLLSPDWVGGAQNITLWGHSDTVGSDAANFRAGEARARAVADYLEINGVTPDRIEIVSLGEGNPVEPNYLPDGSDNEAGQAANRRVEIQIGEMAAPAGDKEIPVDGDEPTP